MQLLVIRHGKAHDREEFAASGQSDELRPLTKQGRDRMRKGARGLHRVIAGVDLLATSPFVRARETAGIVAVEFDPIEVTELDELRPGTAPGALAAWLRRNRTLNIVAVVGHEPHLSELVGWLLTGMPESVVKVRKGGAVLLELKAAGNRSFGARSGTLLWSLAPRQLRMLGE